MPWQGSFTMSNSLCFIIVTIGRLLETKALSLRWPRAFTYFFCFTR